MSEHHPRPPTADDTKDWLSQATYQAYVAMSHMLTRSSVHRIQHTLPAWRYSMRKTRFGWRLPPAHWNPLPKFGLRANQGEKWRTMNRAH